MTWQPDTAYDAGLHFFTAAVTQLSAADWQAQSPCERWRAIDVLGHIGQAARFGAQLLRGEAPAWKPVEPPGATVEGDPASWWQAIARTSREALSGVDLTQKVDSPMGFRTIGEGLSFPALDLFIHAWDISRSGNYDVVIPAEAIDFAHIVIDPVPEAQVRNEGVFADEKPVPPDATSTEAFIAWTGRKPSVDGRS